MSTDQKLIDYAKTLLNNPAKEQVIIKVQLNLLERFRRGNLAEREEISRIIDSMDLFFYELQVIVDKNINDINNQEEV